MLKSFFFLIGCVVLFCAAVIFFLRYKGLKTQHQKPTHQFKRDQFEVIAHRGGGLERPENTIVAFDHAVSLSSQLILEMDVHLTKDLQLVVIHDETVDRTTNGKGAVYDITLEEIQKLDAGYHYKNEQGEYPYRGQGVYIPSLRQVLIRYPSQRMTIELKTVSEEMAQAMMDLIEELKAFEYVTIASRSNHVIEHIRSKHPDWIFAGTATQMYQSLILVNMFLEPIDAIKADAYYMPEIHNGIPVLSKRLLKEMHRRGKPVFVWTVNEAADMRRLINFGVDGIVTDRPSTLFQLIKNQ